MQFKVLFLSPPYNLHISQILCLLLAFIMIQHIKLLSYFFSLFSGKSKILSPYASHGRCVSEAKEGKRNFLPFLKSNFRVSSFIYCVSTRAFCLLMPPLPPKIKFYPIRPFKIDCVFCISSRVQFPRIRSKKHTIFISLYKHSITVLKFFAALWNTKSDVIITIFVFRCVYTPEYVK